MFRDDCLIVLERENRLRAERIVRPDRRSPGGIPSLPVSLRDDYLTFGVAGITGLSHFFILVI